MADYDSAQVQIRLIELAREITKDFHIVGHEKLAHEQIINTRTKWFDQAYKAVHKTVIGE
jgi:hypothetical protein